MFHQSIADNQADMSEISQESQLDAAIIAGDLSKVSSLIEQGAQVKDRDHDYETSQSPLHHAVDAQNPPMVKLLLEHGADIHWRNCLSPSSESPLFLAIEIGNLEIVKCLYEHGGKDFSSDKQPTNIWEETPLHIAARHGHSQVVDYLLSRGGVAIDSVDDSGQTPLALAIIKKHAETAALLIARGANPQLAAQALQSYVHEQQRMLNAVHLTLVQFPKGEVSLVESNIDPERNRLATQCLDPTKRIALQSNTNLPGYQKEYVNAFEKILEHSSTLRSLCFSRLTVSIGVSDNPATMLASLPMHLREELEDRAQDASSKSGPAVS